MDVNAITQVNDEVKLWQFVPIRPGEQAQKFSKVVQVGSR